MFLEMRKQSLIYFVMNRFATLLKALMASLYAQTLIVVVLIVVNNLGFLVIARYPADGF